MAGFDPPLNETGVGKNGEKRILTVTVTTVTCSAPPTSRSMAHSRAHSVPGVSNMKQKTLQFALE